MKAWEEPSRVSRTPSPCSHTHPPNPPCHATRQLGGAQASPGKSTPSRDQREVQALPQPARADVRRQVEAGFAHSTCGPYWRPGQPFQRCLARLLSRCSAWTCSGGPWHRQTVEGSGPEFRRRVPGRSSSIAACVKGGGGSVFSVKGGRRVVIVGANSGWLVRRG